MNAMLLSSGLPNNLWGEAVLSACYVLNRVPHKKLDMTPYELWKGYSPDMSYLKVWGCLAKVALPDAKRTTIGSKTFDCVFIGYAQDSAAYRFMSLTEFSICESRDAIFFEQVFPLNKKSLPLSVGVQLVEPLVEHNLPSSSSALEVHERRRSKRRRTETFFGPDFLTSFLVEDFDANLLNDNIVSLFLLEEDPLTYAEVISSIDASFWQDAIKSEIESILFNQTWELCDLPKGSKLVGSKWIFRKKLRPDGSIDKFKAMLVIKGFTQKKGVDFFDTFSPVIKIGTIRTLMALAAIHDLIVHQIDVKTAFLNGDLEEEINIAQPEGFVMKGQENKVCKLKKSIYGLRQASKDWYKKFDVTLKSNGFAVNASDSCLYSKMFESSCVIICLYVDDMLIVGSNIEVVNDTKIFLSNMFEMKDLGEADVILGIRLKKTDGGYSLSQSHYVEIFLKKFDSFDVLPCKTPYDASVELVKNNGPSVSQEKYAKIIGSVMFLMNSTRPDIAYAMSRLSRYNHNPGNSHWNALSRLLRYLRGTMDVCLHFSRFPNVLEGYSDANWVSDNDEINSTAGYVFVLGGGAISWKSSKQSCIARSTMESEFIALELAGQEAEWLRNLLAEIPFCGGRSSLVSLHCDSQAALGLATNSNFKGKKRHLRIRHGVLRQLLKNGVISLDYVRSERNLADPLIKGLPRRQIVDMSRGMGLKPEE